MDAAAVAVGRILGQHLARAWLAGQSAERERGKALSELIRTRFPDRIHRRRFEGQINDVAYQVAERLMGVCAHEYGGLRKNDKAAVLAEVKETLAAADLSDRAIFAADADPIRLAAQVQAGLPRRGGVAQLGEAGSRLYDVVLDECCEVFVRLVQQVPQFGPRATTEALVRLSGLSDEVSRLLARVPARTLDAPEGTETDEAFRRRYLEHLIRTLDTLELFGVSVKRYRPRTTLSVAYISLSVSAADRRPGHRQPHLDEWRKGEEETTEATVRVETALGRERRTLILGEAGSGKSTLLRWLAISAASGSFTGDLGAWNGRIPFLIKLRSYADAAPPPPERFLAGIASTVAGQMPPGWAHRMLRDGRALLLVDGVDELPGTRRRAVRTWLSDLLEEHPDLPVVVTSRPAAAGASWLSAEGFTSSFLERMTPADVKRLIRHWHLAVRDAGDLPCPPERLPAYESALLARLESAPHLRALAGTPLLTAMLCALNLEREKQLPRDRMGLYAAALDMLLERRDIERQIPVEPVVERAQKMQILQALAWRLSVTERSELPKNAVIGWTREKLAMMARNPPDAETVVEHLLERSGLLREPVPGRIDFVHRTVQEYLTAKQFADDGDLEPLIAQAHRDQWRETLIMAAGHANAPQREELMRGLLHRIAAEPRRARRLKLLLACCLETLQAIPLSLRHEIDATVDELVPPRDLNAARSLSGIGEPILDRLPRSPDGLTAAVARAVVHTAWLINGPEALDLITGFGRDPHTTVQEELAKAWEYFDPEEYVQRVLADAPLVEGGISVDARLLPLTRHLTNLRRISVPYDRPVGDLSFLDDIDQPIHGLSIAILQTSDLRPLRRHAATLATLIINTTVPFTDPEPLPELTNLTSLHINAPAVPSIEFLRDMPRLTTLHIAEITADDLSPLRTQDSLRHLDVDSCPALTDLDQLARLDDLEYLSLRRSSLDSGLPDLVRRAPRLESLYLNHSVWVDDISPLASLPLEMLGLWGCRGITDFTPLARLPRLVFLDLEDTEIADLRPLARLGDLTNLWLRDCTGVTDLSPLRGLRTLRDLYIRGVAPGIDLAPLKDLSHLKVYIDPGQEVRNGRALGRRLRTY